MWMFISSYLSYWNNSLSWQSRLTSRHRRSITKDTFFLCQFQLLIVIVCLWTLLPVSEAVPDLLKMQTSIDTVVVDSDCKVNCTYVRHRPVCATDGRTYSHKCQVKRLRRCESRSVQVVANGRCSGSETRSQVSKCMGERRNILSSSYRHRQVGMYIPECSTDGTYSPVQCHQGTGYCWCVTPDGKPIPGSSVQGREISCKSSKGCNGNERSLFNRNLISQFSLEFDRIPKPTQPRTPVYPGAAKGLPIQSGSDSILDTPEKRVVEWKFSELDINKDNILKRKEIRSLKRLVKKLVKPKACAKTFDDYCDVDSDGNVARSEWSICLGVDVNNESPSDAPVAVNESGKRSLSALGGGGITLNNPGAFTSLLHSSTADHLEPHQRPSLWEKHKKPKPGKQKKNRKSPNQRTTKRDCMQEKQVAEQNHRMDPESGIFIPQCTGAGKYQAEQCHSTTGYCWCVNPDTGLPIPGTSTHDVQPNCATVIYNTIKGCPYPEKKKFISDLLDTLTTQMIAFVENTTASRQISEPNPEHSLEERVARWKLKMIDKNNNQLMERNEIKTLKKELVSLVRRRKGLRKCGRNFLRYCDANKDKKITAEEWISCLALKDPERNLPKNPKRKGPNPFSKYLRS